ncbi:hypothetical protein TSUD_43920 [Trifolium subterraneum]|uniref:Uncharacterized protein n=1 Tax=Trifolium subterraneum TaxID=3900 RepID=A0A2Z6N7Z0_TRISU|nr:hypothetical protein TSUD_43920 [Trifolium subterraneum]
MKSSSFQELVWFDISLATARNDVVAPAEVITIKAVGGYSNKGEHLAIMKTPARKKLRCPTSLGILPWIDWREEKV